MIFEKIPDSFRISLAFSAYEKLNAAAAIKMPII